MAFNSDVKMFARVKEFAEVLFVELRTQQRISVHCRASSIVFGGTNRTGPELTS
jgi:hypothetical protein